jgi:glutamate-1-semialdehyde 2,1-aminomutase
MPVGAYGGSKEIMSHVAPDGPVYQAGTLSANPVAMATGIATLKQLLQPDFYVNQDIKTKEFCSIIQSYIEKHDYPMHVVQIGSIFWIAFSKDRIFSADQIDPKEMEKFKVMHHELLQRGIYLGPSGYEVGFVSAAHSKSDLSEAAEIICSVLDIVFK